MTPRARGAMLLLFDVAADAVDEHDEWHTHEHMPERLAIPGFLRGTRWIHATPDRATACSTRSPTSRSSIRLRTARGSTTRRRGRRE